MRSRRLCLALCPPPSASRRRATGAPTTRTTFASRWIAAPALPVRATSTSAPPPRSSFAPAHRRPWEWHRRAGNNKTERAEREGGRQREKPAPSLPPSHPPPTQPSSFPPSVRRLAHAPAYNRRITDGGSPGTPPSLRVPPDAVGQNRRPRRRAAARRPPHIGAPGPRCNARRRGHNLPPPPRRPAACTQWSAWAVPDRKTGPCEGRVRPRAASSIHHPTPHNIQ